MAKGIFVCVEGLDGCGKTTQTKLLMRGLRKKGYDAVWTAEPSRGKVGRFIRKYFLHCEKRGSSVVEALLFAADRVEHLENEVIPLLKEGKIVISDRYVYSSLAYQGSTGLDLDWIKTLNKYAIRPDLAIFIDVDSATVVKRLKTAKSVMENLETLRKVREVYMKFVDKNELLKIDGNKSVAAVAQDVLKTVLKFLEKMVTDFE
ncbi:MAG TPA: dTMP kinase [Candidatus Bathyarchaeia archaeon]|nr:dTMP kinase [Candidatus Bathyarchaeia archaeon]